MLVAANVLPSSRTRAPTRTRVVDGIEQELAYCINCGKEAAWVPVECLGVSYCCQGCYSAMPPDARPIVAMDVWHEKVTEAQLEADGRLLSRVEVHEALQDEHHYLTKLLRERPRR